MKTNIHFLIVLMIVILLTAGCGMDQKENELNDRVIEIASSKMNSQKEVFEKEKQLIHVDFLEKREKIDDNKEKPANKETVEKEDESLSKEQDQTYTTEKISGEFISTVVLNMRKGPSTDFQLVGNLQPYEKTVVSEKATLNGSTWYKVTSNDVTGWAAANYLIVYEEVESPIKESEKLTDEKQTEPPKQETEAAVSEPKETPTNTSIAPSAIEKAVIDFTNAEREKVGLAPYKIDNQLVASARAKSNDMATNHYFSHDSPTYGSAGDQLGQFGISFRGWGENLAKGHTDAEQVVTAWMDSPGHKENILHPKMTHIGVGYDADGNYWTQHFIYK